MRGGSTNVPVVFTFAAVAVLPRYAKNEKYSAAGTLEASSSQKDETELTRSVRDVEFVFFFRASRAFGASVGVRTREDLLVGERSEAYGAA